MELIIWHDPAGSPATPCWAALATLILALKHPAGQVEDSARAQTPLHSAPNVVY
jgi:hypothetical protein